MIKHGLMFVLILVTASGATADFLTVTFGDSDKCRHKGTLKAEGETVSFDLSALPASTPVHRAVLRVDGSKHVLGATIKLAAVGLGDEAAPALTAPYFDAFDVTAAAKSWIAKPDTNKGLKVANAGGVAFNQAVLELSYSGQAQKPLAKVTGLAALHQAGQTFLTWKEIEDRIGKDEPTFEEFHTAVMAARGERRLTYRVYRHDKPITLETIGQAELAREVIEIIPAWNLRAVRNTEHANQGYPTMNSPLRGGYNMVKADIVPRYRIVEGAEPLARATGLAVFTVAKPAKRYYAVLASIDGQEAAAALDEGCSLKEPVDERPGDFPATVHQRTQGDKSAKQPYVDIYNSWIEPPYHNVPTEQETAIIRFPDTPAPTGEAKLPMYLFTTTYGGTSADLSPGWIGPRRYVNKAFTIGLSEGGIWLGSHECVGTLKGYDQGVVHNYPQRRVLATAAWTLAQKDFGVDPERVCFWSQLGSWALRHGDVLAVVMSNGYGNPAIGAQAQKYGSQFGPYPKSAKNWLGIDAWEYMDLPKWIRENPTVELPYWLCAPAYGAYPNHTVGDFGFMPWPETIHAMAATKRAFAATWNSNGPGVTAGLLDLTGRIKLHQSLPAFGNCSVDASVGDGDHADSEKSGGMNIYQVWEPETIVDEPDRWEISLSLRKDCPYPEVTTDLTPRRCQKFKGFKAGDAFKWSFTDAAGKPLQSSKDNVLPDKWGLVTVPGLKLTSAVARLVISKG